MHGYVLHGKPDKKTFLDRSQPWPRDAFWLPSVANDLTEAGCPTERPAVTDPFKPVTEIWDRDVLERYPITPDSILIGRSAGSGYWADMMSRHTDLRVRRLVLPKFWYNPNEKYDFCKTPLDPELPDRCLYGVTFVHTPTDDEQVLASLKMAHAAFDGHENVEFVEVPTYGHHEDGKHVFPALVRIAMGRVESS